jgi:cytochrome c oxidase subunit 2
MPLAGMASQVHVSNGAPLNYFLHAAGPAAGPTLRLDWVFTAICVAVCVIVSGLLSAAMRSSKHLSCRIFPEAAVVRHRSWV